MPVIYHEESRNFHLFNEKISYIFTILKNGQLGQLYFGKRLRDRESFNHLLEFCDRPMSVCTFEDDSTFSMEHIRQEYPAYGSGDMRYPAQEILQKNGSRVTEFVYKSHRLYNGKPRLEGLPATYVEEEKEAVTLEVTLEDSLIQTELILTYTIYEEFPVIARNARFHHKGEESILLDRAMSLSLDLPDKQYEMIELTGAWGRERAVKTRKLEHGIQAVYSMRGSSSSNYNPFLALKRPETTETFGEAIGFSLVYSGNFLAQAEVDTYDVTRITMGIHPDRFSWELNKGETFQTPEAVMVYSDAGLNGMSQIFHKLYRTRLVRGKYRDEVRPILINNWEGTYFDFNEEKILKIAGKAKELGIELFVLDDGWFGERNDDFTSLGDWYPNLQKLPGGIAGLAKKIEAMGLKFGLWFEPEMTNKKSRLYEEHPDWILSTPGRNVSVGRHQLVLDFSREEVVEGIYGQMEKLLREAPISYVKWDMNRSFSEVFSNGNGKSYQGKVRHKYILGVYDLYERLIQEFPEVLFESCASGGARFDPGMLYYAPQAWTSDNTDAVDRIKIQYGTSYVYPLSSIGSHVSASPNHQVFRNTSLDIRANVAYFGTFGYELDITKLPEKELDQMKVQVKFMKANRKLLQQGTFYRLQSPFENNSSAWEVVSEEKDTAFAAYFRVLEPSHGKFERIYLKGLDPEKKYQVKECFGAKIDCGEHYGDELMYAGLSVSDCSSGLPGVAREQQGDFFSRLFEIREV